MPESILIVDDEESVRKTVVGWLADSDLNCTLYSVADDVAALEVVNSHPVDLAILDWNLGGGSNGLDLLRDLVAFQPDLVAILMTAYAQQATPLDALRMGVRDYLNKVPHEMNRDNFVAVVRRQLERIGPAKREREFTRGVQAFRDAIERVLPLVQSAVALNDPVPLSDAIRTLFQFVRRTTQARDGILFIRYRHADGTEQLEARGIDGDKLAAPTVPFASSLAAVVASMREPAIFGSFDGDELGSVELQEFEKGRTNLLAVPIMIGSGVQVVLELFDKPTAFTEADRDAAATAAAVGSELLRQALSGREIQLIVIDALSGALERTAAGAEATRTAMQRVREGLESSRDRVVEPENALELADAIRDLARRYGKSAVAHCLDVVRGVRALLDQQAG